MLLSCVSSCLLLTCACVCLLQLKLQRSLLTTCQHRSTQYIDYEKLKTILKRAKISAAHRDDLLKRMPAALAAEVSQERKDRSTTDLVSRGNIQGSPTAQSDSGRYNTETYTMPLKMGQHPLEVSTGRQSSSSLPSSATDATPLLSGAMKRKNSWGNLGLKVTSYLGLADDRALLLQSYDDADAKLNLFKDTYNEEVGHMHDIMYLFLCLVHTHMYLIYILHTMQC